MSKELKLMKNTAIIAIGNVFTKCISFFMLPLYTSLLTPSEYGLVDLLTVIITLASCILSLQFEQGLFRFLIDVRNQKDEQDKYISTALFIVCVCMSIVGLISIIILKIIGYQYTFYLISNIFTAVLLAMFLQVSRGLGDNLTYSIASCINGSSTIILNVFFIVILQWNVEGILLSLLIASIISIIIIVILCKLLRYISLN